MCRHRHDNVRGGTMMVYMITLVITVCSMTSCYGQATIRLVINNSAASSIRRVLVFVAVFYLAKAHDMMMS